MEIEQYNDYSGRTRYATPSNFSLSDVFLRHCLNLRTLSTHFNKERNGVAQGKELGDKYILMHLSVYNRDILP